jgi:hypothetical protein
LIIPKPSPNTFFINLSFSILSAITSTYLPIIRRTPHFFRGYHFAHNCIRKRHIPHRTCLA